MARFAGVAVTVIFLLTPVASIGQEIDLAKIKPLIVRAAEELRDASIRSELSARQYKDIMDMSCNTLMELALDDNFEALMKVYEERQYDAQLEEEIREIFLNFRSFLEFVVVERDLLLDSGLSEAAVDEILAQFMKVRLEAVGFKLDAEVLLTDLRRLAEQACSASENVSEAVENDEIWCNIKRLGTFAAGAVAAIADGGALIVAKIPPAAATASGIAGSVVMGGAAMMPQC